MRVGLHTLVALRAHDDGAERAFREWLALSEYNGGPVRVACWWRPERFTVAMIWENP